MRENPRRVEHSESGSHVRAYRRNEFSVCAEPTHLSMTPFSCPPKPVSTQKLTVAGCLCGMCEYFSVFLSYRQGSTLFSRFVDRWHKRWCGSRRALKNTAGSLL